MSANPFLIVNNQLPCSTCPSACCSCIPFFRKEWERAIDYLRGKSDTELRRLSKQKRDRDLCIFVDTENWSCSIYPVRPALCKLFGYHPKGVCPFAPQAATWPQEKADRELGMAAFASQHEIVGISGVGNATQNAIVATMERQDLKPFSWQEVLDAVQGYDVSRLDNKVR